jgi:glycosyltransferase involved in cell wall biosynthesis
MLEPWRQLARELGLEQRAHFLGNVPYEHIPDHICAADVFVLNSEYEGLSHTLLEVSALGTPIVASRIGGNPEVVEHEHNGLLVPLRDDEALRAAIARLLDDPELARRFVAAGQERMQRFDREQTFGRIETVLAGLARR